MRIPKRWFTNYTRKEYAIVNLDTLNKFEDGAVVDTAALKEAGLVKKVMDGVKVLGNGELTKALDVRAQGFTKSAQQKIEAAGGKVEVIWYGICLRKFSSQLGIEGSQSLYDGDVLRDPSWRTYSGSRSRYIYFRKSLFIRKSLWVSGSILRRCSEQIFTFCHDYYPVHQFFLYFAASDFRYSHIWRMAERLAGRV